jgi:hypothetical protein
MGNRNPFRFNFLLEDIRVIKETFYQDSESMRRNISMVKESEPVRALCEESGATPNIIEVHINIEQNTQLVFIREEDYKQRQRRSAIKNALLGISSLAAGAGAIFFSDGDFKQIVYGAVVGLISFLAVKAWNHANPVVKRYSIKTFSDRLDESETWANKLIGKMETFVKAERDKVCD